MSSSQAADRSHPSQPGCSFPPMLLLSQKTIKWFSGGPNKVRLSFVKGVISDVHAAGNERLNFIPAGGLFRQALQYRYFCAAAWYKIPAAGHSIPFEAGCLKRDQSLPACSAMAFAPYSGKRSGMFGSIPRGRCPSQRALGMSSSLPGGSCSPSSSLACRISSLVVP